MLGGNNSWPKTDLNERPKSLKRLSKLFRNTLSNQGVFILFAFSFMRSTEVTCRPFHFDSKTETKTASRLE